jgi:outer membrane protein
MRSKILTAAGWTFAAVLLLVLPAVAQTEAKIAFVDMQRALNESDEGMKALESLKNMMDSKKDELQKEKEIIDQKKEELDKQGLLLNESTRREREDEIRRLERDHSRKFSDTKDELSRQEAKLTAKIRTELMKVVGEIGKDEGYTLILEKQFSAILFAPDSIDLTQEVIKRYNLWTSQ